jgi:aminoglycoside/choline kinase family phosphotransferase
MPQRLQQLEQWLGQNLRLPVERVEPASADASFRRYFRVFLQDGTTRVAMDAPPDKEDCGPFVAVTGRMAAAGLHVPQIHAMDLAQGFILLEDLGSRSYLDALDADSVDSLYGDAMAALLRLQRAPVEGLPPYDRALLEREMALFSDWLLERHLGLSLGLSLGAGERGMLDQTFAALVDNALAQPVVCVHRDYHSRNLMWRAQNNPGVIDFQDAVAGPASYDLVSLLRDCYVRWPRERVDAWVAGYHAAALEAGLLDGVDPATFLEWFDLMGVQRHLKAAGIFARLNHRDGKPGYLADIPRTLGYIVEVAQRRPVVAQLAGLISERVLPALARD